MSLKLGKIRTDSQPITIKQNVQFQVGIYYKKLNLIKFKMADQQFQ